VAIKTTERWRNITVLPSYSFILRSSEILRGVRWIVGNRRFGTVYQSQIQGSGNPKRITPSLFFFQALNFLAESFGPLNDLFPLPSILDAGYSVFDLHLADVLFNVILPSILGSFL
jgi:hypothetical protein